MNSCLKIKLLNYKYRKLFDLFLKLLTLISSNFILKFLKNRILMTLKRKAFTTFCNLSDHMLLEHSTNSVILTLFCALLVTSWTTTLMMSLLSRGQRLVFQSMMAGFSPSFFTIFRATFIRFRKNPLIKIRLR